MSVKVGLAQMTPRLGDLQANLAAHLDLAGQALDEQVELLIFPELSLTGYSLRDLVFRVAVEPSTSEPLFARLLEQSRRLDLVVGFVERDQRHRYYISSAYLSRGEIIQVHRKVYLPTYGMFDEGRYFARGGSIKAFDTQFGRVGLLICEDFWHVSPPYLLWLDGADLLIMTSSAPGRELATKEGIDAATWVEQVGQVYAGLFTNYVIHVNRTGVEYGVNFFGGSTIFDPSGNQILKPTYYEEGLFTAELDLNQIRRARIRLPLLRDERSAFTARELRRILQSS